MNTVNLNEVLLKDRDGWLYFSNPYRIIAVEDLESVPGALNDIERMVENRGWHAAGFLSYEAASAFDPALLSHPAAGFSYLWFGLYPQPQSVALPHSEHPKFSLDWRPSVDRDTYNTAIDKVRKYISEGRTYQVNYTIRLQSDFDSSPWEFFLYLAQTQNNHAAYLDTGRYAICSASPELFFELDGETIISRPMKGTVQRGRTTQEDRVQADWLTNSEKNRAENVMIVDMIRNDMGRIAKIGSVHVPELFHVERYPTLWQMTSTISAHTNASLTRIFSALYPCASITGAPKVSTMRIIHELEATPRRIYTGTIGYLAPGRKAKFNVAIRTALIDRLQHRAEYGVGGGIVWDSTGADEYAEALLKARVLTEETPEFSLLETMLWTPEKGFFLREKHIARMLDSAGYFDFPVSDKQEWLSSDGVRRRLISNPPVSKEIIETFLDHISSPFTSPQRVRLFLDKNGVLSHEARAFRPGIQPVSSAVSMQPEVHRKLKVYLAEESIVSGNVFLFHKTTYRDMYDCARKVFPDCDDVLLYNGRGELTEFTTGNLVVEMDDKLFTPTVSCGLLAGTFREHLLETGQVEERVIRLEELGKCSNIFLVNSVRKWQGVEIIS